MSYSQRNVKITQLKYLDLLGYDASSLCWWFAAFRKESGAFETLGIIHPMTALYPKT
jgi:hypothetical protein